MIFPLKIVVSAHLDEKTADLPDLEYLPGRLINHAVGIWSWFSEGRAHYNFWLALSGSATLWINGVPHPVSPGFAVLLHPEDAVEGLKPVDAELCNVGLHFQLLEAAGANQEFHSLCSRPFRLRHLTLIGEMIRYMEQLQESKNGLPAVELNHLCRQILRIFVRDAGTTTHPLEFLIRQVAYEMRHYPGQSYSVAGLAARVELSESQFTRRFKSLLGESPIRYLIGQRMERAAEMLVDTRLQVYEIADALGFQEVAFFSRQFKQYYRLAPLAYRRAVRERPD